MEAFQLLVTLFFVFFCFVDCASEILIIDNRKQMLIEIKASSIVTLTLNSKRHHRELLLYVRNTDNKEDNYFFFYMLQLYLHFTVLYFNLTGISPLYQNNCLKLLETERESVKLNNLMATLIID